MSNLLTLSYWFGLQPEPLISSAWTSFLALVAGLFAATIILAFLKIRPGLYRGFLKRLYALTLTSTLIGLLLLFFNYEAVPFFSARFWIALWGLMIIVWFIFIARGLKDIPRRKKELTEQKEREKYLP